MTHFMPLEKNILKSNGKHRAQELMYLYCTDGLELLAISYNIIIDRKILEMLQVVVNQHSATINWIGWKFINAKVYNS